MRPLLDLAIWAANAVFSSGTRAGANNKVRPSNSTLANGYGSGNQQPADAEINWILNQPGLLANYLDSIEALNFVAQGAKTKHCIQGIAYKRNTRLHYAWGLGYDSGSLDNYVMVWSSPDAGHTWTQVYKQGDASSSTDEVRQITGKYAVNPDGEWLALGSNNTQPLGLRHNILYMGVDSVIHEITIGFRHGCVRWVPGASVFLIGSKPVAVTGLQTVTGTGPTMGFCAVASQRTADIEELAVGSVYVLMADVDGYMWRAPANLAGGFLPLNAAAIVLPGIIYLDWMPGHNAFIAITRVGTTYHLYRSTDGSIWTETGNLGALVRPAHLPRADAYIQFAVSGTTLHAILNDHGSGLRFYRGFTNDFGVRWRFCPLNMAALDGADDQRYPSLHNPANDDRVLMLMTSNTVADENDDNKETDTQGSLRLGDV